MDKMQMAHDWAIELLRAGDHSDDVVSCAWKYADAMQAEADKRKPSGLPDALKEEWQPDWSQAPNGYNYWVATADHNGKISGGWFYDVEPEIGDSNGVSIYYSLDSNYIPTGSFGYQGNWKDSLRERPE